MKRKPAKKKISRKVISSGNRKKKRTPQKKIIGSLGLKEFTKALGKLSGKKLGELRNKKTKPRVDPLWTLEQGVTYSQLSSFITCRHRFHIGKVQGWKPKGFSLPLEFGNIFHLLVEAQDRGIPMDRMHMIADNYVNHKIDSHPDFDAETIKELGMMGAVANVTFQQYAKHWERNYSFNLESNGKQILHYEKDFDWIGKETEFKVPYTLPTGQKILLRGKQDGKFKVHRKTPGNWLFETKTKGDVDVSGITAGLHKDMQTGLYLTAMEIEHNGALPRGVLYNVIRRTRLKPRVKDTAASFSERVEADIIERPQFYFFRWTREISKEELSEFQRFTLNPVLFQLLTWWNSIKRNPMDPFQSVREDGEVVDNPHHWERPFGVYDSMSMNQRGEFFDIITNDNYFQYEQAEFASPELDAADQLDQYL